MRIPLTRRPSAHKNPKGKTRTVLLIDDEDDFRHAVGRVLTAHGFSVIETRESDEGVRLAVTHRPDVVLTDVVMKKLDGFMLLECLRELEETRAIPVVMMTGKLNTSDQWKRHAGDRYLVKPFGTEAILQTLQDVFTSLAPATATSPVAE